MKEIFKYILLLALVIFFFFPIYWLIITAFKVSSDWFDWPPVFIPTRFTIGNFLGTEGGFQGSLATAISSITPYLSNSIVVALVTALASMLIGSLTAYAISRFKIGGMFFASWIISIRMLPPIAAALPLYVMFSHLNLLNTKLSIILGHLVFTTPFSTWILITFFNDIPRELDEAAYVDGASMIRTFVSVILPLSAPGLAAVASLAFIQSWGEFLLALILTSSAESQTLPIYLGRFITGWRIAWGPLAAAGLVTMVPVMTFSLIMQRYLLRGLTFGAVKY
ncbi:MAG TPA: carbohydrate ABC transporter permease [Firmicutes bacterium]|nr:carbohydrate ABC transporter permease [Bacillota bacterium]